MKPKSLISPVFLLLTSCAHPAAVVSPAKAPAPSAKTMASPEDPYLSMHQRQAATLTTTIDRILEAVLKKNDAWNKLQTLCDEIGHRLSGSIGLVRAIEWAQTALTKDGHENVHTEPVSVPHWIRGKESARMIAPRLSALPILGLGGSVGTPKSGIRAEVVVVKDEAELEALGETVVGKIVLFNNPMPKYDPEKGSGYGRTVRFRVHGARMASEKGAVAILIRSVTAHSLRSPHTGAMHYGDAKTKIPAAALTIEDAEMIARLTKSGVTVKVELKMEAKTARKLAASYNVIAELRGRELPDEIVVIGGHIDSWDTGQGAHDDGAGCVIAMEALNALRKLKLVPRRTIRVVLWTNEENGLAGAKAYAKKHQSELKNHVAAIESDSGAFAPIGFGLDLKNDQDETRVAKALEIYAQLMNRLRPQKTWTGFGGADVGPLRAEGVPAMGLRVEGHKYFNYHHSHADTLDKVNPRELSEGVASMAAMAYVLAEIPQRIDTLPIKALVKSN